MTKVSYTLDFNHALWAISPRWQGWTSRTPEEMLQFMLRHEIYGHTVHYHQTGTAR